MTDTDDESAQIQVSLAVPFGSYALARTTAESRTARFVRWVQEGTQSSQITLLLRAQTPSVPTRAPSRLRPGLAEVPQLDHPLFIRELNREGRIR